MGFKIIHSLRAQNEVYNILDYLTANWHKEIADNFIDSMEKAIKMCPENETSFIIGGGEIYYLGLPFTDKIEITRVHESFDADAFFPEINLEEWKKTISEFNKKDEKHLFDYSYDTYLRK